MEEVIIEKKGIFPKKIIRYTNEYGFKNIIKISNNNICDDYIAYSLMESINISLYFAKIYPCIKKNNKYISISENIEYGIIDIVKELEKNNIPKENNVFWNTIIQQLAYVVFILEENKIQHNDFHTGNLRIQKHPILKYVIKIIDLETVVDYKNKIVYPNNVVKAKKNEQERMGWNSKFHIGADLNQMLGEIIDQYRFMMPKKIIKLIDSIIIKENKEFPYAISYSNSKTSGKNVLKLLSLQ